MFRDSVGGIYFDFASCCAFAELWIHAQMSATRAKNHHTKMFSALLAKYFQCGILPTRSVSDWRSHLLRSSSAYLACFSP